MRTPHPAGWTRRRFLGGLTLAGTAGLLGLHARPSAAEPPPETTTLKIVHSALGSLCLAPQYVAEDLLQGEGFANVHYILAGNSGGAPTYQALAAGEADVLNDLAPQMLTYVDAGTPLTILSGLHIGCFELVGTARVRAIHDLKGKTVAVSALGSAPHLFLASMAAYVGLNPRTDITWVMYSQDEAVPLLIEGKIDALMAFAPAAQELRARQIGHVVVNSAVDRPWSHYFCCMVAANRAFVQKYPVAAKRALRALLKAADVCALEPDRAAQSLVDKGVAPRYDHALQTMKDLPYGKWREYDPEDSVRFYALRLHEAGMIKSIPQKIIAQGTDWRFLNELKKELKG
jgi:NitT/TauT family transport system substrate-binding protein